jgi:subtilase family serine protease
VSGKAKRTSLPMLACALVLLVDAPASAAIPAGGSPLAGSSAFAGSATAARLSAAPALVLASPSGSPGSPSRQGQIKVLTRVLQNMHRTYAKYRYVTPGAGDIFDYQIGNLWKQGIDGYGTTVAVIEGWDDPRIAHQVASYDKLFGLPNPQIKTIFPAGPLPGKCPPGMQRLGSYGSCAAWMGELQLDVISVHLVAPYAKIIISATPADTQITDDAASQVAPPEMMEALEDISTHHLANAISISDGTGEVTYRHGAEEITAQAPGELAAAAAGIPVTVATGDCGVVQNLAVATGQCQDVSKTPDTAAWDDSPWVTAVGGSVPNLNSIGQKAGPDPLWHGEGAGFSSVFQRPGYQNDVARITGPMRSVPDITMDAQDGTSEAAPLFAGVLALATQLNGGNVGPVNPALYGILGPAGASAGVADVLKGNDSAPGVPGFAAVRGFDVASGWGTVNASRFVPSLVAATRAEGGEHAARHEARDQLAQIEHSLQLTSTVGGPVYLLGQDFLPGHPVALSVDGRRIATLTASTSGYVTYMINPARLKLSAGQHTVLLTSMLVTETGTFHTS